LVTIEELEKSLYASEKIVIRLKAEISQLEELKHPEFNKVYVALKKILEGNDEP